MNEGFYKSDQNKKDFNEADGLLYAPTEQKPCFWGNGDIGYILWMYRISCDGNRRVVLC